MNTNIRKLTIIALAVAVNIAGSKIALALSLPIFLDSIGTMLSAIVVGPVAGLATALVGGLINGALGDIYSIYFAPSGMLMGLIAGLLFHNKKIPKPSVIWRCALVTVPASAVSALIETILFDGITSAVVTTLIIQTLSKTSMKLFGSAFLTQAVTDYVDKFIAIVLMLVLVKRLPYELTHFDSKKEVA